MVKRARSDSESSGEYSRDVDFPLPYEYDSDAETLPYPSPPSPSLLEDVVVHHPIPPPSIPRVIHHENANAVSIMDSLMELFNPLVQVPGDRHDLYMLALINEVRNVMVDVNVDVEAAIQEAEGMELPPPNIQGQYLIDRFWRLTVERRWETRAVRDIIPEREMFNEIIQVVWDNMGRYCDF